MTLLHERPLRRETGARPGRLGGRPPGDPRGPRRATLVALLLASATLITVDASTGALEPARQAAGAVFGPAESTAATVARPLTSIPDWFRTQSDLTDQVAALEEENDELRGQLATRPYDRAKLASYEGLTRTAEQIGYAVVPARVIGLGPAQSFSLTATIDAGSDAGLRPDMTVVSSEGLVGRVLRVTASTATVLSISDPESVVGGRVGDSGEAGFVHGTGGVGEKTRLDLELLDQTEVPRRGAPVVTWGSNRGAPYVSGVPIGQVTAVYSSVRDSSQRAEVRPFVDFAELDVVGVVVPSGTESDRAIIEADGELR
ncbi:rod shape-determining protein MreC [Nocardioides insulae]|uniref:rod shape-determining protein MreC n=1 Tax=Nocardioides insulae TaxID=394734 RepID=UPI0006886354|nr:rod shape-determining protein MreC [Nocardioides insulae]